MYSLVLMTAMATAPQSPDFNGYFRERWEQSGLFSGDRVRSLFSFGGGNYGGSCSGSSCKGSCNGSRYNCTGSSCNGSSYASCSGCSGSMAYAPSMGCSGGGIIIDGSPYATPSPASFYDGPIASAGCFGSGGTFNPTPMNGGSFQPNPMGPGSMIPSPNVPFSTPTPAPDVREYTPKNQLPPPGGAVSPNRATVVVKVPQDAKLYAEGRVLNLTGSERSFVTPELPAGREYSYTFKVEYDRGGRTLGETQTIKVAPGRTNTVEFIDLVMTAAPSMRTNDIATKMATQVVPAAKGSPISNPVPEPMPVPTSGPERAKITVKVPTGATLFVDEKKNDRADAVREFNTPVLQPGKEYNYVMKVETTRNGLPEQVMQKVVFRAGDNLTVDFTTTSERSVSK